MFNMSTTRSVDKLPLGRCMMFEGKSCLWSGEVGNEERPDPQQRCWCYPDVEYKSAPPNLAIR